MEPDIFHQGESAIAQEKREPQRITHADSLKDISILVVDDDPFVLELLTEYLKGDGYNVLSANCGEEAISRLSTVRVDVALVDLKMSGMDGLATIERMGEIDPDTVTILMTGFPTLDSSVQAIKLGASDYILKPFEMEEVSLSIRKAVKVRNLRLEMKSLRKRVSELEKGISERRENIKVNQKVGVVTTLEGYSTKVISPHENHADKPKSG